ncbi:primosomal protein N' [Arachidicoccus ginsenosidimutans]|uniref:replication restart helicase PriA n=1 Tax=Arachidicoccus sp. BS20 TaxID=1850526 RepID=UPI0007F13533|nr:primosomal protein N' [Arachidicoccus sp. BS20]ANI88553.1 primosomal protein N' [Arachidicoccus sp. BS20]
MMQEADNLFTKTKEPQHFAEIIIPLFLPQNYTWSIPAELIEKAKTGIRVEVSLRNKKYSGIIKRIFNEEPQGFQPKPILNILDDEPLVFLTQLKLWQWMSQYYLCTEGDVMQAAVPSNFKLSSESVLIWNDAFDEDYAHFDEEEYLVTEALHLRKELRLSEVQQLLDASHVYPIIKKLVDKQVCFVWEELQPKYTEKKETFVSLHPVYKNEKELEKLFNDWNGAPKQMELLLAFLHLQKTEGDVVQKELLKKSGATVAQLKALINKKILSAEKRAITRLQSFPKEVNIDFNLSAAQEKSFSEIKNIFLQKDVCLLHGVTASGKTQIYIRLIEEQIRAGKQVLYMLPEIALTAQIIRRLQQHFGGHIAIYHSKFNPNERVEIWNKIKNDEVKIVLGARSALLLPFKDLGLIIVDEEHDASYKQQEPAPRYNARDTAVFYASLFGNAKVLLGSATPSIETFFNCKNDKFGLVTLSERYENVAMPEILLENLNAVPRENNQHILSPALRTLIEDSLKEKKQVILFQNRRGYAPYQVCKVCGWIPQCSHCAVSLTYHKGKNKLSCHYCGTDYPVVNTCVACGSHEFIQKKFGTEQIEEIVAEAFPTAKVARMDYDSVRGKHGHETLIKIFEQQKIDILIGTQMVVKGLDFEHVNLVGILDADGLLHFPDFRVNERAFQLMEQVSGRAGRKDGKGKVLVQVSDIHHPVLQFVQSHNYAGFYDYELASRRQFAYPPYSRLIQVVFKHKQKHIAEEAAIIMTRALQKNQQMNVSGPAEPLIDKIRNLYLWELLIKLPRDAKTIQQCKQQILQQIAILQSNKRYASVMILPDIDPL